MESRGHIALVFDVGQSSSLRELSVAVQMNLYALHRKVQMRLLDLDMPETSRWYQHKQTPVGVV
jgi:hypothetical protein